MGGTPDDGADDGGSNGGLGRRRLVQLLVALAFGIPLLVEGLTFLGLVENLTGSGETPTPAASPTPTPDPVREGEELLPETQQTDRLAEVRLEDTADGRELTLVVEVSNESSPAYSLRLSRLTTADGDQVQGGGATDTLGPGESTTLTARWSLPADVDPVGVEAVASVETQGGKTNVFRRVAPIAVG